MTMENTENPQTGGPSFESGTRVPPVAEWFGLDLKRLVCKSTNDTNNHSRALLICIGFPHRHCPEPQDYEGAMFVTRTNFNFSTLLNVSLKSNRNIRMKKKKVISMASVPQCPPKIYICISFLFHRSFWKQWSRQISRNWFLLLSKDTNMNCRQTSLDSDSEDNFLVTTTKSTKRGGGNNHQVGTEAF